MRCPLPAKVYPPHEGIACCDVVISHPGHAATPPSSSHRHNSHRAGSLCATSSQDPIPTQPRSSCSTSHGNSPSTRLVDAWAGIILQAGTTCSLASSASHPPTLEQLSSQAPLVCQQASAGHPLGLPDLENGPRGKWWWGLLELVRVVSYQLLPPS